MGSRRFELAWDERRVGPRQTPRRFLDFVVDGRGLYAQHGFDLISCLGWLVPEQDDLAARRLLRKAPPDLGDRVAIYVCPEDGDLLCGAITARIERDGKDVVWRDLAHSWPGGDDEWTHEPGSFAAWPELRFDATEYWHAIAHRPLPTPVP